MPRLPEDQATRVGAPDVDLSPVNADAPRIDPIRSRLEKAVSEHYTILRLLGRGGMGSVYLARDKALERLVAIKVLPLDKGDEESRARFRREARMAAQLTHPNIVPLLSFGEVDGAPYLVMGYVRGEALSARLQQGSRLRVDEARRVLAQVADALDHAHRQGVVHRDVKPDNIMIEDETGRALLTDFGIAKPSAGGSTLTQSGGIVGTPAYMSPEQAAGQQTLDGRSDLYSLGVTGYVMLCGRLPFSGSTQEVLLKHLSQPPPPLLDLAPELPQALADAVTRCLAKDPAARFPDGRSLHAAVAPVGLDDDELPEPLDALDGLLPKALACAISLAYAAVHAWCWPQDRAAPLLFACLLLGILVYQSPLLLAAMALARRRFPARTMLLALARQPTWWPRLWYPPRFRRTHDVWNRLPRPFRHTRILVTLAAAGLLLLIPMGMVVTTLHARNSGLTYVLVLAARALLLALLAIAIAWTVTMAQCARIMRSRGLDTYTLRRVSRTLLVGNTSDRAAWRKPELLRVLLPVGAVSRQQPRSPQDCVQGIADMAEAATGALRTAATEAAIAGRRLLRELESLDALIARLRRDSDPAERERLSQRITSLDGRAADDAEVGQMQHLLRQQLELLDRLGARREATEARQRQAQELLRQLWAGLANGTAPEGVRALIAQAEGDDVTTGGTLTRA